MPEIEIKDKGNNTIGKVYLSDDIYNVRKDLSVVHEAVVNFLANQRQGTHATKTRGLVRGGGRKPWRQKHTGRARAGSIRSPLWKGGGIVFGPQPRDYRYSIPKKKKKLAFMTAFSKKLSDGEVIVIDGFSIEKPKTKEMINILRNLNLGGKTVLIVLPEMDTTVVLSARNIPGVHVKSIRDLNVYDVVVYNSILITKDAIASLDGVTVS